MGSFDPHGDAGGPAQGILPGPPRHGPALIPFDLLALLRVLQCAARFGIGGAPGGHPFAGSEGCGCSSGVEHDLAKVGVEGSNPFARSNFLVSDPDTWVTERT